MMAALFLGITNDVSTDLFVSINRKSPTEASSVQIMLGGDTECETFIQGLEYALRVLKAQVTANGLTTSNKSFD